MEPAQMASLGKIYNSLKDGMSKPEDWFETTPAAAEPPKAEKKTLRGALGIATEPEIASVAEETHQEGELALG